MQQLILTGFLGGDPEMRYTPNGKPVTNFSVADTRKYADASGQTQEETTWFRVQCWERLAEVANEYLKKGSRVLVMGTLIADEHGGPKVWVGKDNLAHASFRWSDLNALHALRATQNRRSIVRATHVEFLDRKLDSVKAESVVE